MLTKFLLGFVIYFFILALIAYYKHWKEHKKFLNPKLYFVNVWRSISQVHHAFAGDIITKVHKHRPDGDFLFVDYSLVEKTLPIVHQKMISEGYVGWGCTDSEGNKLKDTYVKFGRDCDDFAKKITVELYDALYNHLGKDAVGERSLGISRFQFITKKGIGHEIMTITCSDGVRYYFEPYPGEKFLKPRPMTPQEIASGNDIM